MSGYFHERDLKRVLLTHRIISVGEGNKLVLPGCVIRKKLGDGDEMRCYAMLPSVSMKVLQCVTACRATCGTAAHTVQLHPLIHVVTTESLASSAPPNTGIEQLTCASSF